MAGNPDNGADGAATDDVSLLPAEVPVGWFVFDDRSDVWVEVTGKPVTFCGVTIVPAIDGFNVPLMFDEHTMIPVCPGVRGD